MRLASNLAAGLLLAAGCRQATPPPPAAAEVASPRAPLSGFRTTGAGIAVANLNNTIAARERDLSSGGDLASAYEVHELTLMRAQFLGRASDMERALELSERLVREERVRRADARLARAQALSALHRFPSALADLDAAQRLGADADTVDGTRAAVFQATGKYDDALAIRRRQSTARPDITTIGAEAALLAEMGRSEEASARFRDAVASYRDVSPFPVAWNEFREGLMWMRLERFEKARPLLEAAYARLPAYSAAAGHLGEVLAELGETDRAIELLRAAAEASGDPDPAGQLARILEESGRGDEAGPWREKAAGGFKDLVARHPEAFADHAAEFWLGGGNDPDLALELARRNAAVRPTRPALDLLERATQAAREEGSKRPAVRPTASRPARPNPHRPRRRGGPREGARWPRWRRARADEGRP